VTGQQIIDLVELKVHLFPKELAARMIAKSVRENGAAWNDPELAVPTQAMIDVSAGESQRFGTRCVAHACRIAASQWGVTLGTDDIADAIVKLCGDRIDKNGATVPSGGAAVESLTDGRLRWYPVRAELWPLAILAGCCVVAPLRWDSGLDNDFDDVALSDPRRPAPQSVGHCIVLRGLHSAYPVNRPREWRIGKWKIRRLTYDKGLEPCFRAMDTRAESVGGWWRRDAWIPVADATSAALPALPFGVVFWGKEGTEGTKGTGGTL
jgi:hypothetical protein